MIGIPEPEPFRPDPFQVDALDLIRDYDVLVSAATGAGKTWIASQAIHSYLTRDLRVWYASPLKALSNSIYREFSHEFGAAQCGILTGDRKENPEAPVIIGTTEILRNQLYDAMHEGTSIRTDLVILDEAHYLDDPERGVVWEEVLIYLPSRVKLLLLSATISNAEEICAWLKVIRGTPNRVVLSEKRPVPLEMLFLLPDGRLVPLGGKRGLSSRVKKFLASKRGRSRAGRGRIDFGRVIQCLREFDLLPAIFFLKSRSDCDRAIMNCPPANTRAEKGRRVKEEVKAFLREYPHLKGHRQIRALTDSLVGSHHGGQLPYWKILVEKMMNRGFLEAIFSTSTVAAGVNFPARTVVLVQSDRYNGREFADLTATELHQMIGRAGRRGKDNIGFALILPGIHQNPQLICELKDSSPEPVNSQIHINFSMTLNLLLSHSPLEIKDLLELSFATFRQEKSGLSQKRRWDRVIRSIMAALPQGRCDTWDPYEIFEYVQKRAELQKEARRSDTAGEKFRSLPCEGCKHLRSCHGKRKGPLWGPLKEFLSLSEHVEGMKGGLWLSFRRHLRFLKETGFVDEQDRLSPDGEWASKLRLDQPLLIAEAIRKGAFSDLSHEILAGCLAPFVWDRDLDVELSEQGGFDLSDLEEPFEGVLESIVEIRSSKSKRGFESPRLVSWPAAALFVWAKGVQWEHVLRFTSVDEGDLASLVMRTADHLRQFTNLAATHPRLAAVAGEAVELILREPVYIA